MSAISRAGRDTREDGYVPVSPSGLCLPLLRFALRSTVGG